MVDAANRERVRDWFVDTRGERRRMHVTHRPELGVVVLSLWDAERCRATFRLDVDDAVRLLHDLVDVVALGDAGRAAASGPDAPAEERRATVVDLDDRR